MNLKRKKKRRDIQCYNCKEQGHIMKDCPYSPRAVRLKQIC